MNDNTVMFVCSRIKWDTDGDETVFGDLPHTVTVEVPSDIVDNEDELIDYLGDEISDQTGWCHFGFKYARV